MVTLCPACHPCATRGARTSLPSDSRPLQKHIQGTREGWCPGDNVLPCRRALAAKVPEAHAAFGTRGSVHLLAGCAGHDRVDICGSDIHAVKAVGLVDLGDLWVTGLGEDDVDALLNLG